MAISYTGKLAAHEAKFQNIAEKFKAIMNLNDDKKGKEIFAKNLVDPNHALTESEKTELSEFVTKACDSGLNKEFSECNSKNVLKEPLLLLKVQELVSSGLVDSSAYMDKSMSYEEQIAHLEDLLSSANESLLYETKYPEVGNMNVAIREFRDAVFSMLSEFRAYKEDQVFGADSAKVQESFDSDFKSTVEVLKETWEGKYNSGNSGKNAVALSRQNKDASQAIATYTGNDGVVNFHKPEFHENPRLDSKQAIDNLDKKASYHLTGAIGTMQVAYFKNVALPYLVKGVCALAKTSTEFSAQIKDHAAFNKAKYVMANFKTIFEGIDSNYYSDVMKAYEDMQNIRVKTDGVASYDLDTFFEGVQRVIKIVAFAEHQHEELKGSSKIETITDLCPELDFSASVPLLTGQGSEDNCKQHDAGC